MTALKGTSMPSAGGRHWSQLDDEPRAFDPPAWINIVATVALAGTLLLAVYITIGVLPTAIFGVVACISILSWATTTYRRPASRRAIPFFILTIIITLGHAAEQHYTPYTKHVVALFPDLYPDPADFSQLEFVLAFVLLPASAYLFGAAGLFYHTRLGNFAAWWLYVWCLVFPASHFVLSGLAPGSFSYLPGMATAPVLMTFGALGVRSLLHHRLNLEAQP